MTSPTSVARRVAFASIVNDTLRQYPVTVAVFNQFGIDACCGGAVSIGEAAARDGADPGELLAALNQLLDGEDDCTAAES